MSLTLKGKISFDKENLPPYIFKFNIALVVFFAAWFVLCLPPVIVLGCVYGESPVTYITMIAVFAAFFIGLLILCTVALLLRKRLVEERAAQLEVEFADMPLDEATQALKSDGKITDYGFITGEGDVFGNRVIPFDKSEFCFYPYAQASTISFIAEIYDSDSEDGFGYAYVVDRAMFNFLDKRGFNLDLESNKSFAYLKHNKKNFCRYAFGFKLK